MYPTALELAYNVNYVCKIDSCTYFTYQGEVWCWIHIKTGSDLVLRSNSKTVFN